MRWLPWRRKPAHERPPDIPTPQRDRSGAIAVAERTARGVAPPRTHAAPRGAALTFARDALALSGAQVRVEDPDLLAVTLPDGMPARYTGSLTRARGEADATLLVQGGAALGALLDEVTRRGARVAFALPASGEPASLAVDALAGPAVGCGHCITGTDAQTAALCAACPLRAGRLALAGVGRVTGARELRRHDGVAVELTYRVTYRDRDGRRDETHRLAYDAATGEPVALVPLDALAACAPRPLPESLDIATISQRAHADLARTLDAGAALLALRATAEYQRRLHDLDLTHERLLRETPEAHAELEANYAAERGRLADLFAVGVEAELASVAYVSTTLAEVVVRHSGGELALTVDLGRGVVLPPSCAVCGSAARAGTLCLHGHLACAACAGAGPACPVCAGVPAVAGATHRSLRVPHDRRTQGSHTLTVEHLADLSEPLWQTFVSWYLASEGHAVEPPEVGRGIPLWRLRVRADAGDRVEGAEEIGRAVALRPTRGRRLGAADVRAVLDAWRQDEPAARTVLIAPAPADAGALSEAAAAGVRLVERDALAAFLRSATQAHATELAVAGREAEARAQAAGETQAAILDALKLVETEIGACVNGRRATGRGPLAAATNTVTAALREAERALLAWETLVTDWLASFDERPAPDGSLRIARAADELRALAGRAEHLRTALARPVGALAATPGTGESGYTAWRKTLLEQLTAACEALCWRACAVNLEHWHDAAAARDAAALAHAEAAAQVAKHTASRAAKARDLLAARIGL